MAAAVTREAAEVWALMRRRPQELRGVRVQPGIGSAGRCGQPEEAGQPHGAVALAAVSIAGLTAEMRARWRCYQAMAGKSLLPLSSLADEVGGLIAAHDGYMVNVVESLGMDVKSAFRQLALDVRGPLLGYRYNDLVVVDLRLQFGWRSSPGWWSLAGGAIEWWYRCRWTTEPDAAYRERAALWHSPGCRNFWRNDGKPHEGENVVVWEMENERDEYEGPYPTYVIYCPQVNLVYVGNVKAGSSTINAVLSSNFKCTSGLTEAECRKIRARTTWLDNDLISGMLFFSVVREPIARFKSGYMQAVSVPDTPLWGTPLKEYLELFRLSGSDANGRQVPMHFVASLGNLEADLQTLWSTLGLPPLRDFPHEREAAHDPNKAALDTSLSRAELQDVCAHLMQDFICFGYRLPPECTGAP
ncbi:hypothetical protein JKP88DRAFT_350439 [Tribonema minus]|uniref:Uncharacterized protein n=1 Tax=Tribonema minus TaxID=303371 RepID=A0A835YMP6_9STRA|nr:hypothetical protein JKP88DRAFT_350439 [Tribonema minus]